MDKQSQQLITAFFEALRMRHLEQCQALLAELRSSVGQQPVLEKWVVYLEGILAFEIEHDWATATQRFTTLLESELDAEMRGRVLYALARSQDVQGLWPEAIATFQQKLELAAELGQKSEQAKAWNHMAISYRKGFIRGDFGPDVLPQAVRYCNLALDALAGIPASPETVWLQGTVWNTLGLVHVGLRQWTEALSCYEKELAICQAQSDQYGLGLTYGNLGEVYQKLGDYTAAQAAFERALAIIRDFGDRYEEIEALANLAYLYQQMEQVKPALDYYRQAVNQIEALRAGISSEAARAGFFATIVDTYANLVLLCLAAGRPAEAFNMIERARSRTFLDTLSLHQQTQPAEFTDLTETRPITLAELQQALPTDAVLIEYFTTGLIEVHEKRHQLGQTPERHRFPPAKTLILAVTSDALHVFEADLSPNELRPRRLDSVVERHFLKSTIRQKLYDQLVAPIEHLLEGRRRLFLVPHGPLHYIPFQALINREGQPLLRDSGPELIYAPSATMLLHTRPPQEPAPASCMAVGYNGVTNPLRFAEQEARNIAGLTAGQVLAGASPKKAALVARAGLYRRLHFSCHGEFNPERPLASRLYLAPGETMTALDVMLNLRLNCDLVTLSACESGLSRVRRGDELVGFMRAFMVAGAPALVTTLWRVDERSTAILMKKFYLLLQAGHGFAAALKQAQLYLRTLSRREAEIISRRMLSPGDDDSTMRGTAPGIYSEHEDKPAEKSSDHGRFFLKGIRGEGRPANSPDSGDISGDDLVFADPFYWAPFILVGGHNS